MEYVIGFFALLVIVGLLDVKKAGSFQDFVLAGRRQGVSMVSFSLMASCIGGSATVGVVGMAYALGFPAFWWLGSGAAGLLILGFFLANKLRKYDASTLPDLAGALLGKRTRPLVSLIIVPAWLGITAAQFVAIAKILQPLTGMDQTMTIMACAFTVTVYATLGGQLSVLKTDFWQFLILSAALIASMGYLYVSQPLPLSAFKMEFLNAQFSAHKLAYYMLIMGGSYVVCPMLFSRLFTARTPRTARLATLGASLGLVAMSLVITAIGLWAAFYLPGIENGDNVLTGAIVGQLPGILRVLLIFGLLAAITSSADSCLLTVGSIIEHDLFGKRRVGNIRLQILVCGILSALIAWRQPDIIGLLLDATTIFTAGVVAPVAVGLIAAPRRQMSQSWAMAAVLGGGILGIWSGYNGNIDLAMLGVGLSAALSVGGVLFGAQEAPEKLECRAAIK